MTIGDDGRTSVLVDGSAYVVRPLEMGPTGDKFADYLCRAIIHTYKDKYETLGKKDACDLMSEWAEKDAD